MPAKVTLPSFDFSSCSVAEAKGAVLSRLAPDGSGHTAYCLFRGGKHQHLTPCPAMRSSWRAPVALEAALEGLMASGAVLRLGAYHWLRPGRAVGKL